MTNTDGDIWYWHHNRSECYYHIQITVKYRKSLLDQRVQNVITEVMKGLKERYDVDITTLGYDQNHMHILCRFLPKYSGGEFWTDGYYIATVSGKGDREVIENYIKNQGMSKDLNQLKLFELENCKFWV